MTCNSPFLLFHCSVSPPCIQNKTQTRTQCGGCCCLTATRSLPWFLWLCAVHICSPCLCVLSSFSFFVLYLPFRQRFLSRKKRTANVTLKSTSDLYHLSIRPSIILPSLHALLLTTSCTRGLLGQLCPRVFGKRLVVPLDMLPVFCRMQLRMTSNNPSSHSHLEMIYCCQLS